MEKSDSQRELVDYFKKNVKKGYTIESLKTALIQQGYNRTRIEKSLDIANKELAKTAPILREKPEIKHEIYDEGDNLVSTKRSLFKRIIDKIFSR